MKEAITQLLAADHAAAARLAEEPYERLIASTGEPLVLAGAGEVGENTLRVLRQKGVAVACFVDNNPVKWGTKLDGLPILSPRTAGRDFGDRSPFVVTFSCDERTFAREHARLARFGARIVCNVSVLLQKWAEISGWPSEHPSYYQERADDALNVLDMFADAESRDQFVGHLRWRLLREYKSLPTGELHDQYFREEIIRLVPNECFVDGGAFDGDSIRTFLYHRCEAFSRIHAFEPDARTFPKLQSFVSSLQPTLAERILAYPYALADRDGIADFTALGNHSSFLGASAGSVTSVRMVALDQLIGGENVTFIKLDLEGGEMPAIAGAEEIIRRRRPIVTVAVYHKPSDLLDIPLRLRALCNDYSFHLRTHSNFGFDIVLYAVPRERAI